MDTNLVTENQLKKISIKKIDSVLAIEIFPSLKEVISKAVSNRIFFVASIDNNHVGIISLKLTSSTNAHIDYIAVKQANLFQSIARELLWSAETYCYEAGYSTITSEIVNPKDHPENVKTFQVYEDAGYKTLFEIKDHDKNHLVIFMQKLLSLDDFIFIDLTHSLSPDLPHWGIDVAFKYNARFIQSAESPSQVKFRVQRLEMSAGIGTHMDAPSHCFENAPAIDAIPLQSLITTCRVIDVSNKAHATYGVTEEDIDHFEDKFGSIPKRAFVIISTGWDEKWSNPEAYRNNKIFPYITVKAAERLLSRDIVGVGIDTLSPDAFGSDFPVHQLILKAGKYIIENVANAKQLDPIGNFIFALPIKITDGTEAPMRLIGMKRKPIR